MTRTAQDVRKRRLLVEEENMARLETRLKDLQSAFDDASYTYNAALAVMNELGSELEDLKEEHRVADGRIQAVRNAYRRELMSKVPDDIIRLIFLQLLPGRKGCDFMSSAPGRFGSFRRNIGFSVRPFALAGVCRKWREVALGAANLWSFIHVRKTGPDQFKRVSLLLARSKSLPLDVCIKPSDNADIAGLRAILAALLQHASRIHQMQQSHGEPELDVLPLIQRAGPHLRRFFIHSTPPATVSDSDDDDDNGVVKRHYVELGPHIEEMLLIAHYRIITPKRPYAFPTLVSLIWNQPGFGYAWDIILAARETLREVVLAPISRSPEDMPPLDPAVTLRLPNLEQLHIVTFTNPNFATYISALKTPQLKILSLPAQLFSAIKPFLEAATATVTTLILHGDIEPRSLDTLSVLTNVEHLMFSPYAAIYKSSYEVTDAFFARLATPLATDNTPPSWIWPKLSTISLSKRGSYDAGDGDGILHFVRSRTSDGLDDSSSPHRLTSVILEDTATSTRLRDEVKRMLK